MIIPILIVALIIIVIILIVMTVKYNGLNKEYVIFRSEHYNMVHKLEDLQRDVTICDKVDLMWSYYHSVDTIIYNWKKRGVVND